MWRARRGGSRELAVEDEALAGGVRIGRLRRAVLHEHARVRALGRDLVRLVVEQEAVVLARRLALLELDELALERADVVVDGGFETFDALLAQPVLQRRQHNERRDAERDRARGQQREQQPPAQACRQPSPHDSRKR
jgi:hypothetical protein